MIILPWTGHILLIKHHPAARWRWAQTVSCCSGCFLTQSWRDARSLSHFVVEDGVVWCFFVLLSLFPEEGEVFWTVDGESLPSGLPLSLLVSISYSVSRVQLDKLRHPPFLCSYVGYIPLSSVFRKVGYCLCHMGGNFNNLIFNVVPVSVVSKATQPPPPRVNWVMVWMNYDLKIISITMAHISRQ